MARKPKTSSDQLPLMGYQPIKEAIEEERDAAARLLVERDARVHKTSQTVERLRSEKLPSYRVRVHPFEKHKQFERLEKGEDKALSYVETIKKWLLAKPKPLHILVEMSGVVWRLWSCETTSPPLWEEERFHD